jgi:nucleotide-binding universal stress UspA family protein
MRTLLIPIDFTETSDNAIDYASGYCRQFDYRRIILLKSFYDTVFDEVVMSAAYGGVGTDFKHKEHENAEERLRQLSRDLSLKNEDVEVVAIVSEWPLMRAIAQVVHDENPRAILVGSDNNAYDNDSYVSNHVIQIARTSPINVIVVPAGQSFQPIQEVLIPIDTFTKGSLARLDEVSNRPYLGKMKLDILKFDTADLKGLERQQLAEENELHSMLGDTRHELFSSGEAKAIDAILNFLRHHPVQLILALPGKYSFLYRLTHKIISESICRNTEKPVLIVKRFL